VLDPPGSEAYEAALDIFNGAISARPQRASVPRDLGEIEHGLLQCADAGWSASIRAGGHGVAGRAVAGDVVVDVRGFRAFGCDGSRVRAGAGLTWGELDRHAAAHGLVVPGGTVSTTGVTGLALGGGIGWLLPRYGLTCDRIVGVAGVSAEGRRTSVDDESDPELMAALRGYGHGLLVVTEFEFDAVPMPTAIQGGSIVFSEDVAVDVLVDLIAASPQCPETINWSPSMSLRDGGTELSIDGASFEGSSLQTWVTSATAHRPIRSSVRPRSYEQLQSMLDNSGRWGQRTLWRSTFLRYFEPSHAIALMDAMAVAPGRGCQVFVERVAGTAERQTKASLFPLRWADYDILVTASWDDPADDAEHRRWVEDLASRLRALNPELPDVTYVNYADPSEAVLPPWSADQAALSAVRARVDPDGLLSPSRAEPPSDAERR
jgi:hypothetical protein